MSYTKCFEKLPAKMVQETTYPKPQNYIKFHENPFTVSHVVTSK